MNNPVFHDLLRAVNTAKSNIDLDKAAHDAEQHLDEQLALNVIDESQYNKHYKMLLDAYQNRKNNEANADALLASILAATSRSQLENDYDIAITFLDNWLDAGKIDSIDYHAKKSQFDDAYHSQLLELSPPSDNKPKCPAKAQKLIDELGGLINAKNWLRDLFDNTPYIAINTTVHTAPHKSARSFTREMLAAAINAYEAAHTGEQA